MARFCLLGSFLGCSSLHHPSSPHGGGCECCGSSRAALRRSGLVSVPDVHASSQRSVRCQALVGRSKKACALPDASKRCVCFGRHTFLRQSSWLGITAVLVWAASLAKEIGITVVSASLPLEISPAPACHHSMGAFTHNTCRLQNGHGQFVCTQVAAMILCDLFLSGGVEERRPGAKAGIPGNPPQRFRSLLRWCVLAAVVAAYVRLRSWLAVNHLVSIYRKVLSMLAQPPALISCEH